MTALLLDPLGQSILRQLAEADEAYKAFSWDYQTLVGIYAREDQAERSRRFQDFDRLSDEFITHLTLIGSPDVDISEYIEVARQEALIHEDDRDNRRVFDAAQDIVYAYLELWRGNEHSAAG